MRTIATQKIWLGCLATGLALGLTACKSSTPAQPANIVDMNNGADPAAANLAPVDPNATPATYAATTSSTAAPARVLGQRSEAPASQGYSEQYPDNGQDQSYDPAYDQYQSSVDAGQAALYADDAPPPLPVYQQPELTQVNDQWTPGYWSYGTGGYYWVPGAWVAPPYSGALWTPGYWGYEGRRYRFHHGFWGRHIGFYGGISYGFGYFGHGYEGGYWNGNNFYYNRQVNRVNVADVRNVYVRNVTEVNNRISYNGPGGYNVRPQPAELAVYREQRLPPMQVQRQQAQAAATNRQQFFSANHGSPAIAVNPRVEADRSLPRAIEPVQRGGFGQPGQPGAVRTQAIDQRNAAIQQRTQAVDQRNAAVQQRTQVVDQRNAQMQQRTQAVDQRNAQMQQRTQAVDQRNAQLQQRNAEVQQRNNQVQQRNNEVQQRTQAIQQRNAQAQQQHAAQPQAVRPQPVRPAEQPRAQPAPQQRIEPAPQAARPQPAQQPRPQPAAQPRPQPAAQPHPAPQAQPHQENHGGEHPHR